MKSKILLLEDDCNLSETVSEYLLDEGFDVTCVYDGDEAIASIYEHNYDLLLLDIRVPKIDGFSLVKYVRESNIDTPIIILTSLTDNSNFSHTFFNACEVILLILQKVSIKRFFFKLNSILYYLVHFCKRIFLFKRCLF